MRTSPTGPMPATGWSSSSIDIAIIARVCPMPLSTRSASRAVAAALPRMTPPWSAYRKRVSSALPSRAMRTRSAMAPNGISWRSFALQVPGNTTGRGCRNGADAVYLRGMPPRPAPRDLRASDGDRDRVVAVINAALADGRLTPEEHDERVHNALRARTLGDLEGLTTDLVLPDGQPIQLDGGRPVTALFRKESRTGRWVVPAEFMVNALGADVTLDFREALLTDRHTVLHAHALAGTIRM